jgi:transcriptional regulator with XRE-family HTH domain
MNERLQSTMNAKHVSAESIAEKVGVDVKTVQRWISGRMPHPKFRWEVARILEEREDYLWPADEATTSHSKTCTSELIAAYAQRSDVAPELWWEMFTKAQKQIDLLGFALLFLPEQHPDLIDLLDKKSQQGCRIRIAMADPGDKHVEERDEEEGLEGTLAARITSTIRHFRDIQQKPNIEIRFHRMPLYNSIFRFDEEMFVTPHLYKLHGSKAPLLYIRKLGPKGLFSDFASHFENVWVTTIGLEAISRNKARK